jgi:hypothetical protein
VYAVIAEAPLNGAVQVIMIDAWLIEVVGAKGVSGICAARIEIGSEISP